MTFVFIYPTDAEANDLNFKGKRVDLVSVEMTAIGLNLLPETMKKELDVNDGWLEIKSEIGKPFAKISQKSFLGILQFDEKTNNPFFNSNEYSITIRFSMTQYNKENKYKPTGFLQTGLDNLLILNQKIPISFMSANE